MTTKRIITSCLLLGLLFSHAQNITGYVILQEYDLNSDALKQSLNKWVFESGNISKDNLIFMYIEKDQINRNFITIISYPEGTVLKKHALNIHGFYSVKKHNVYIVECEDENLLSKKNNTKPYKLKFIDLETPRKINPKTGEELEYEVIQWEFIQKGDMCNLVYMEVIEMIGNNPKNSE
jgi:hypothetical protein